MISPTRSRRPNIDDVDALACSTYLLLSLGWSSFYPARVDDVVRRLIGKWLGTSIVVKSIEGRFGPARIWGSATPVEPTREARLGFIAMFCWLVAATFPPFLLLFVQSRFEVPSTAAMSALMLMSIPIAALTFRGLIRTEP